MALCKWQLTLPVNGQEDEYFVSLGEVIQGIRHDLAVVEGDIKHDLELFIRMEFDKYRLMSKPNVLD